MTFRIEPTLADEYRKIKAAARNVRAVCEAAIARTAASPTPLPDITRDLLPVLTGALATFAAPDSGLIQRAKDEEDDQTYDVAAEFTAMRSALQNAVSWMVANLPKDGSNRLLQETIDANGIVSPVTVSVAATAGLRTELQAVVDTIG